MEQIVLLENIAIILLVISITFFISALLFWFFFRIPNSLRIMINWKFHKKIKRVTRKPVNNARISWNTSGRLTNITEDCEETQVLNDELLSSNFEIEQEIKITGSEKVI